jgi:hypothetical protein
VTQVTDVSFWVFALQFGLRSFTDGVIFPVMVVKLQQPITLRHCLSHVPFKGSSQLMGFFYGVHTMFDLIHRFKGQCIAYGGGTLVSLWSKAVSAVGSLPEMTFPQLTINDLIGIGGLLVITGRLAFDIFVYIDKRKQRNQEE